MRWQVQPPKAGIAPPFDQLSAMQEAGAQNHFDRELTYETETVVDFRCKKRWFYGVKAGGQRRIREAVIIFPPVQRDVQLCRCMRLSMLDAVVADVFAEFQKGI